tara:strand:+ start:3239 stop:3910 length:672 start_codon:yes stop_codon:yes gene_type:complete
MGTNCITYMRASTDVSKQANSIIVQRTIITSFCERNSYSIEREYSEYASGRDDSREQFNLALQDAIDNDCLLVCHRIDRLGRSMSLWGSISDHLHRLRFVELGNMEPNLMALSVMLAAATQESINTSVRVATTIKVLKANDPTRRFGNPRMFETAYPKSLEVRQRNAAKFNDHLYSVVVDLRKAGYTSIGAIAKRLNQMGLSTRHGKLWTYHNLYRVIRNHGK